MLTKEIQALLARAMSDKTFADELFVNTDKALANYTLTADEMIKLKRLFSLPADGHTHTATENCKSFTFTELGRDSDNQT